MCGDHAKGGVDAVPVLAAALREVSAQAIVVRVPWSAPLSRPIEIELRGVRVDIDLDAALRAMEVATAAAASASPSVSPSTRSVALPSSAAAPASGCAMCIVIFRLSLHGRHL